MTTLVKRLEHIKVHPYYVYMHDLVKGVEDLRTSIEARFLAPHAVTLIRSASSRRPFRNRRRTRA
jgi:L-lysine 2,3-aminomutase